MTGPSIPGGPASDQQTLEDDRYGHLHILDQGPDEDGMANRCMPGHDGGAGDGVYIGEDAEKDEEKEKTSQGKSSNTKLDALNASWCRSAALHVSLTTRFINLYRDHITTYNSLRPPTLFPTSFLADLPHFRPLSDFLIPIVFYFFVSIKERWVVHCFIHYSTTT